MAAKAMFINSTGLLIAGHSIHVYTVALMTAIIQCTFTCVQVCNFQSIIFL